MRGRRRLGGVAAGGLLLALAIPAGVPALAGAPDPGPDFNRDGTADLAIGVPREDGGSVMDAGAVSVIYGTWNGLNGDTPIDDQLWTQSSAGVQGTAETGDRFGYALATGDFDGDGYDDLAIGAPYEDIGSPAISNAGVVHVLYGSSAGLTAAGDTLLTQDVAGIADRAEPGDLFGFTLVSGEFGVTDADDLAVGIPYENLGDRSDAGAVSVIFGSSSGLTATGDLWWTQDSTDVPDVAEVGDRFGWSLASGNFGNGRVIGDDLAIGAPYENGSYSSDDGAVTVIYSSWDGLGSGGIEHWAFLSTLQSQDGRRYGYALAAADFGVSSETDLAISAPYEDIGDVKDAGVVRVLYGDHFDGLSSSGRVWHQDESGMLDSAEENDLFGYALAAGDLGKSGYADLAIGVPGETKTSAFEHDVAAGAVIVVYAYTNGGLLADDQMWWQDSTDIEGSTEPGDRFGSALAIADFGKEATRDLAVGTPGEDGLAGAVNVIYSTSAGLASAEDQFWWQASSTIRDSAEAGDRFGSALGH